MATAIQIVSDLQQFLSTPLETLAGGAERNCYDRFLYILDALEKRSFYGGSLLDIGAANGFFSYLFAVTFCGSVTAVEDARAASAGYGEDAFLGPLWRAKQEYSLDQLEIVEAPVENFLSTCPERRWDAVLFLGLLHHFFTGYGDQPEIGRLSEIQRVALLEAIGRATGSVLYLEYDHGRTPEGFAEEFRRIGGFKGCHVIGSCASAVGETRLLFELTK